MAGYSVGYRLLLSASAPLAEMNGSVRKKCHEDESARSDFVSLYLCEPRPDESWGKITTASIKEQDVRQTKPGKNS